MAKLSVIVPAHNEEKYLENTLKAAKHPDAELIVVCNGCTDKSVDVAVKLADKVFVLDEAGVSKARNFGALKASASRLVFLDADIVLAPDVIDKILASKSTIGTTKAKSNVDKKAYSGAMWLKSRIHRFGFCTGLIFCDKDLFDKVGGFDELRAAGEDGKLLRAAKKIGDYGVVDAYVFNNMRRFEKLGYIGVTWFWLKHLLFGSGKKYEVVR